MTEPTTGLAPSITSTAAYADASCVASVPSSNTYEPDAGGEQMQATAVGWSADLGIFLMSAWRGPSPFSGVDSAAYESSDGVTWSVASGAATAGTFRGKYLWIAELGKWVLSGGQDAHPVIGVGASWRLITDVGNTFGPGVGWVAWSGLLFVASADDGGFGSLAKSSTDGVTWTTGATFNGNPVEIVWASWLGLFVAVGFYTIGGVNYQVATSTDGSSWDFHQWPGLSGTHVQQCLVASQTLERLVGGVGVANGAGESGAAFWYSDDGATWTAGTSPWDASSTYASAVVYQIVWADALGLFVAVGGAFYFGGSDDLPNPSTAVVATSSDGVTWTTVSTPLDGGELYGVAWSHDLGRLIAVGSNVRGSIDGGTFGVISSTDAVTWTRVSGPWDGQIGTDTNRLATSTGALCATEGTFSPPTVSGASPAPDPTSSFH